jgi:ATP-dependent Clp protease ATP-binding subunit ClpC
MFERYTEKARRVIFFARYEASQFGQPYIETEHLLLGILREDKALGKRFLRRLIPVEKIRQEIEAHAPAREKTSTSVDLPLSNESKRVMAYTAEEAERLGHKYIGSEHLLLGLLREEKSFAAVLLNNRGVKLDAIRKELENEPQPAESRSSVGTGGGTGAAGAPASTPLSDFARDVTQAALEGRFDPLIGREKELGAIVEILCRRSHSSVVLIGERGTGKSAIVEGLAQRIADGSAPAALQDKQLMSLDAGVMAAWALGWRNSEARLNQAVKALIDALQLILVVEDLERFIAVIASEGSAVVNGILKHWLMRGKLVCVGTCTPDEYGRLTESAPWVRECFSEVHIHPLDEETTRQVVESRKHHYESFHGVTYAEDALDCVARASGTYLQDRALPGKALELLDAAGSRVKLRQNEVPDEIRDATKKIKFVVHRIDNAIANHEFEKARFYSDEECKERENLRGLREKHHLQDALPAVVTREDVEEVIGLWSAYPFKL